MLRLTYARFLLNPVKACVDRAPSLPDCNFPVAVAWGCHHEHRKIPSRSKVQRSLEQQPQANRQRQLGYQPSIAALLPQLSEINGVSGMYRLSIYAPLAAKKAMMPAKTVTTLWFELWKEGGFLHVEAASSSVKPLQLPVFVSDGWGFPSRSAILRMWQERDCDRWAAFKNYLLVASSGAVPILQGKGYDKASCAMQARQQRQQLDMRLEWPRGHGRWLFLVHKK